MTGSPSVPSPPSGTPPAPPPPPTPLVVLLLFGIPGAAFGIILVGIVLLALKGDPSSSTLNLLATEFGTWTLGGGAYMLIRR